MCVYLSADKISQEQWYQFKTAVFVAQKWCIVLYRRMLVFVPISLHCRTLSLVAFLQ